LLNYFFFFFQAEDGIRDLIVTGVRRVLFRSRHHGGEAPADRARARGPDAHGRETPGRAALSAMVGTEDGVREMLARWRARGRGRSEERRVGEGCRGGWAADRGRR